MGRIPVGERGGGEHFVCSSVGEASVAGDAVEAGQSEDAAFHVARSSEQGMLPADNLVDVWRNGEKLLTDFALLLKVFSCEGVGGNGLLDGG